METNACLHCGKKIVMNGGEWGHGTPNSVGVPQRRCSLSARTVAEPMPPAQAKEDA